MERVTPDWQLLSIAWQTDRVEVSGVSLWDAEWSRPLGHITVADPAYGQVGGATVYEVPGARPRVLFAAVEFSNGVWGFYLPTSPESGWSTY
jgi:hypothetical protein